MTGPTAEERERREYADGTNLPLAEALGKIDVMNKVLADLERRLIETQAEGDHLRMENDRLQS